jgi:hypothetical protein
LTMTIRAEIAAARIAREPRSDVSPGPGLRNRDPAHLSSLLPEPVRHGARPSCHRPFWPCQVALWHEPRHARRYLLVRRLANR